jgi:hypothetical protein
MARLPAATKAKEKRPGSKTPRATAIVCPRAITNHNAMRPSSEARQSAYALAVRRTG